MKTWQTAEMKLIAESKKAMDYLSPDVRDDMSEYEAD
jgi:hypothetical protein